MTFRTVLMATCLCWGINVMGFEVSPEGKCMIGGKAYPAVGFGTYRLQDKGCVIALDQAADQGYRIIDTATFYNNFAPVGQVLKKQGRENFYLISKVWPDAHTPDRLQADLKNSLAQLQTDYLDAYLLHWPNSNVSIEATLGAMEDARKQGLIRDIGLSNVTVNHLKRALECNVAIAWVQVEMNPKFFDAELVQFCHEKGILVQAWAPLGRGKLSEDRFLSKLGEKYGKTASQIAIRWIVQHGCIPLPASSNPNHMKQNFDVLDFSLTLADMEAIDARAKEGSRERVTTAMGLGFADEFDYPYEKCWPKRA